MSGYDDIRREIEKQARATERALLGEIADKGKLVVVKAPPGSGKTHLLLNAVAHARKLKLRCAIACQTNTQTDDICRRIAQDHPTLKAIRYASVDSTPQDLGNNIDWITKSVELPTGPCVVVSTAAKWALSTIDAPYDVLFVDEAWQLAWKDFMPLGRVAGRFVLIGDPGQIPPVVPIDARRWATAPLPPQEATPNVIANSADVAACNLTLPATWRLPHDSAALVQSFYDFSFGSYAGPGERSVHADAGKKTSLGQALSRLAESSAIALTIPTPDSGPPMEQDDELARAAVAVVQALLAASPRWRMNGKLHTLEARDIGITATHRVMNAAIDLAMPRDLREQISIDTPERWQGLERPIMLAIHPLSGVLNPTEFSLETGRMCVMASRHRGAMIMLGRDHIADTLAGYIPSATQAIGMPDVTGRGHMVHQEFWAQLQSHNALFKL